MTVKKKHGAHLFIDTNVLLSFYAFAKDDLEQLDKLVKLIHAKSIKLYLTQQVVDEFMRNRETNLANSLKEFRGHAIKPCPSFMRDLGEFHKYERARAAFDRANEVLLNAATKHANEGTLLADTLFNDLTAEANVIAISEEAHEAAYMRKRLGNPPGKQGSIGDELNWELLLKEVPKGTDLHIISKDKDYASPLVPTLPKAFLVEEWQEKRSGKLALYEQIGQFFSTNFPDEDFSLAIEKREAMDALINSHSFAMTHYAVDLLSPYVSFLTDEEAEEVVQGAMSNSQVAWIASDSDVEEFLKEMLKQHGEALSAKQRLRLRAALGMEGEEEGEPEVTGGSDEGSSEE
ncbi:MAG TPA: PIN domain-containing protein [Acidobacteriaceae bacterium]|nr:PIN domain-containing protein [Acidobacteriaceae bacterium]